MGRQMNYGGFVIAGIGFFLTRFTVTLALYEDPIRFYLAGIVPLLLGLGLAAFGVALVVADVEASLVRTTARWCIIGVGTMLVLVLLTLLGSTPGGMPALTTIQSQTYLSNFLIGGSVGGTLTGLYAAATRRQHNELQHQANRLEVLNRMLRHEVLNAVNVIQGYASFDSDDPDTSEIIHQRSDAIAQTIKEVRYLTWSAKSSDTSLAPTDLMACLRASVATVNERYPEATISVDFPPDELPVRANERLEQVFTHLLENAIVHTQSDTPTVEVRVDVTNTRVRVSIRDNGPGLPVPQQTLLETGEITEFDDPQTDTG